ncbi:helix-turn-helix domain-containing protein [Caballeronia sp. 15711]|uniref:helix-turn-helix domain-containing protein n=1 Tax=Caballeronia sp. 15711 TaxID=3391029 RepID=UPI0039E4675D
MTEKSQGITDSRPHVVDETDTRTNQHQIDRQPSRQVVLPLGAGGESEIIQAAEVCARRVGAVGRLTDDSKRKEILEAIRAEKGTNDSRTQCSRLLAALTSLGSVTTFEASRYLDIYHPPARKRDLVRQGHPIRTGSRMERTECGSIHRVGEYQFAGPGESEVGGGISTRVLP